MSIMIIFAMYAILKGKYLTIKMILMKVLGKYFNVHHHQKKNCNKILEQTNG